MKHFPPRPAGKPTHTGWSPYRDRQAQEKMRRALIKRAGGQCEYPGCRSHYRLIACHIKPVREGGDYSLENGVLYCFAHAKQEDPYTR